MCESEKNVRNSARFLTTFDFDREYTRNDSRYPKPEINVIDSDYSCAQPNWDGGPPNNDNREKLKFGLKFSVCALITSRLVWVPRETFRDHVPRGRGDVGTIVEGPPLKFGRAKKTSKFQRDFWQLSTSIANISRVDRHIEHLENVINHNPTPSRWGKEIWWTLVHNQKSSIGAYWPTEVNILR